MVTMMPRRRDGNFKKVDRFHIGVAAFALLLLALVGRSNTIVYSSDSKQNNVHATITTTTSSYSGIQGWYRDLVNKRLKNCHHTSPFFHYFLPHDECSNTVRYGKCNDGAKWICLDKFDGRNTRRAAAKGEKCIIYSFGSSDDSCFETAMAENFDCEIHIFDPTSSELKDPRWTYHSYGLGGADPTVTSYWDWRTQRPANCTACPMKNLKEIMTELGHSWLDVLKVDIDGAEWRSFEYIYKEMRTLPTDQLQAELTGLDITPLSDSSLAGGFDGVFAFWDNVLKDGFKLFQFEPNYGTCGYRTKNRSVSIEYAMWRGSEED